MNLYTKKGEFIADIFVSDSCKNHDHIAVPIGRFAKNIHFEYLKEIMAIIDDDKLVICTDEDSLVALSAIEGLIDFSNEFD